MSLNRKLQESIEMLDAVNERMDNGDDSLIDIIGYASDGIEAIAHGIKGFNPIDIALSLFDDE